MSYINLGKYFRMEELFGWRKYVYEKGYVKEYVDPITGQASGYEVVLTES